MITAVTVTWTPARGKPPSSSPVSVVGLFSFRLAWSLTHCLDTLARAKFRINSHRVKPYFGRPSSTWQSSWSRQWKPNWTFGELFLCWSCWDESWQNLLGVRSIQNERYYDVNFVFCSDRGKFESGCGTCYRARFLVRMRRMIKIHWRPWYLVGNRTKLNLTGHRHFCLALLLQRCFRRRGTKHKIFPNAWYGWNHAFY